jgi:hypothetical protein
LTVMASLNHQLRLIIRDPHKVFARSALRQTDVDDHCS